MNQVIVMSATMHVATFQLYFDCPLVSIDGRNHKVDILHLKEAGASFVTQAAALVVHIHKKKEQPGDILVFLPGQEDIKWVCSLVRSECQDLDLCPLYSTATSIQQELAVESAKDSTTRKVIVATNIAETSLTSDGVVYVVDCGLSKQSTFNPRLRMQQLETRLITQASANQPCLACRPHTRRLLLPPLQ
jgi:HrpA-like RNA helicase